MFGALTRVTNSGYGSSGTTNPYLRQPGDQQTEQQQEAMAGSGAGALSGTVPNSKENFFTTTNGDTQYVYELYDNGSIKSMSIINNGVLKRSASFERSESSYYAAAAMASMPSEVQLDKAQEMADLTSGILDEYAEMFMTDPILGE